MGLAVHGRKCSDVAERADALGAQQRAVRLRAILDDLDAARVRDLDDLVDLGCLPRGMHDHGGGHVRRNPLGKLVRSDIVAAGLTVHEPRLEPVEDDRRHAARVGDRRDQHFAALGQIKRRNRDVER